MLEKFCKALNQIKFLQMLCIAKRCIIGETIQLFTAWKVSKYGVISGLYLPVFNPNTGKYGPEITPHLDTFHALLNIVLIHHFYVSPGPKPVSSYSCAWYLCNTEI